MCGICGAIGTTATPAEVSRAASKLVHRGPDQSAVSQHGLAVLGHQRLSIIDLSEAGRQPMSNEDGSVWIVFNGEIYNFPELRLELEQRHRFHSRTDTEILIHGYEEWGIQGLLRRIRGMFAFAIWDNREKSLFLARDHLGKKPLFYSTAGGRLDFASTIPALLALLGRTPPLSQASIIEFLNLRYIPAPNTIFEGISQLLPACYLTYKPGGAPEIASYWRPEFQQKLELKEGEWLERIQAELERAVRQRLVADVPVGAFLSGGIDSSIVTALMAKVSGKPPLTISMRFSQDDYDESSYAQTVARHLESEHFECAFTPDMLEALPEIVWHFGQPFADPAAVPTYFLSKKASEHVKVVITGDGGDEAFGGYPTVPGALIASRLRYLPGARSGLLADSLAWLEEAGVGAARRPRWVAEVARGADGHYLPDPVGRSNFQNFPHALGDAFEAGIRKHDWAASYRTRWTSLAGLDWADRALGTDLLTLLPNALLTKMDVMTMAHSVEARSPFLDADLMELCGKIPSRQKVAGYQTKPLLRQLGMAILPKAILTRKKHGFIVPMDEWFRGELRGQSRAILLSKAARERGLLNTDVLGEMLTEHQAGAADHGRRLWLALILELWCRMYLDGDVQRTDPLSGVVQEPNGQGPQGAARHGGTRPPRGNS